MAESLTQQVTHLFKTLLKRFNHRIAQILLILANHKSAGSLGALAGFAISVIFTWKFLRSPVGSQRKERRDTGCASTSDTIFQESDVSSSTENCQPIQNAERVGLIEGFGSPSELALGCIVKKKLNGGRKMTCRLLGVILEESSPEELQIHATVRPSVVEVLLEISRFCDIYLMERILDDESWEIVILALKNAGLFKCGALMEDKVLFCGTENGISSFVRQLEPDWHLDTNPVILSQLARFIRYQLYISSTGSGIASGSNIVSSASLESYFAEDSTVA